MNMVKNGRMVGVVLPFSIYEFIEKDLETGDFINISDWIRTACKDFYDKRRSRGGGGGN